MSSNITLFLSNIGQHPAFKVKVKVYYDEIEKDADDIITYIPEGDTRSTTVTFEDDDPRPGSLDLIVTIESESYFGRKGGAAFIRPEGETQFRKI